MKNEISLNGLILIFCIFLFGCSFFGYGETQKFSGTLELTEYSVGARAAGRISTLLVDEGSLIHKGDLLATLDRYDQAKKDLARVTSLLKQGGTSEQALEQAQLALDDQSIISPVDGIVLVKGHEMGEVVAAGTPVVTVGDLRNPWVRIYVPEGIINKLQVNQEAKFKLDGIKKDFKGHILYIAPRAEFTPRNVQTPEERVTQTFAVKVLLDQPNVEIHPGVSVDVTLNTNGDHR